MQWLVITWFLAFGYVPVQNEIVHGIWDVLDEERVATVAQIGIEAEAFKRIRVFGDVENFQYLPTEKGDVGFRPFRIDYTFGAEVKLATFISVVAMHNCDHVIKMEYATDGYESSETKVIVKISGKTNF